MYLHLTPSPKEELINAKTHLKYVLARLLAEDRYMLSECTRSPEFHKVMNLEHNKVKELILELEAELKALGCE